MDEHAFPPTGFLWLSSAVRYIRIILRRYVAPHNVKRCFHNDSRNARVCSIHALLQWNNYIYIVALFAEISSRKIKSEKNDNSFIRTFRSSLVKVCVYFRLF